MMHKTLKFVVSESVLNHDKSESSLVFTFHAKHEHAQHPVVYLDPSCTICRPIFQLYRLNHNAQTIALATAPLSHSVPTYLQSLCSRNVFTHYSLLIVIPGQLQSCICGYLKPDNPNRH